MSLSEGDIVLFEPSKRDMLIDYPELSKYDVFTKLSKSDMKFIWYISNRTSPIIKEPKLRRIKMACELVYDKKRIDSNERVSKIYKEQVLPEDMVEAIEVMASFNPSFRMQAKLLNEHNFNMIKSLSYISEDERMNMDLKDKKDFADLIIKTTTALGGMISNMETGYGIKVKKEASEKFELKANVSDIIDRIEKTKD